MYRLECRIRVLIYALWKLLWYQGAVCVKGKASYIPLSKKSVRCAKEKKCRAQSAEDVATFVSLNLHDAKNAKEVV